MEIINEIEWTQNFWKETDTFKTSGYESFKRGRRQYLAKKILKTNPKSVLEIGCFGGYNLREISELNPNVELTGFDINAKALDYAKERLPSMNTVNGNIHNLMDFFSENNFDVIFTAGVLIHIPCSGSASGTEFIQKVINNMAKISSKFVFHAEHHGLEYKRIAKQRYVHNFLDLYQNFHLTKLQIEEAPDASNGFEQIIEVALKK